RDLHAAGGELAQGERGVDDVAGILHRADAALLVGRAEPGLATEPANALRDVVDLLVDLSRGDLELVLAEVLPDGLARDERLECLLPLPDEGLGRQLGAGDDLSVDHGDRIRRVDRDLHLLKPRHAVPSRRLALRGDPARGAGWGLRRGARRGSARLFAERN